ncbi:MAG: hypothetical protein AAGB35_02020 [Pseudomonadota bacterium]
MSDTVSNNQIKEYFLNVNRMLTIGLVFLLVVISALFWLLGISMQDISIWVGMAFMLLAVVFYRIPRLSYSLTKKHFLNHKALDDNILNSDWGRFKKWLEDQNSS